MLKSETLQIKDMVKGKIKKPVLIRYTILVDLKKPELYTTESLKLMESIKSLPDEIEFIEFIYELTDSPLTSLIHQKIIIKINHEKYYRLVLDDDLEVFFLIRRLFKAYENEVETYEQIISEEMLSTDLLTI